MTPNAPAEPRFRPEARLAELNAKVRRGKGLAMAERLERQGIIFNHSGAADLQTKGVIRPSPLTGVSSFIISP